MAVHHVRALKLVREAVDSEYDSRLGTDGNQEPASELREGAADDAALLISLASPPGGKFTQNRYSLTCRERTCPGSDPGFSLDHGLPGIGRGYGGSSPSESCPSVVVDHAAFHPACDHDDLPGDMAREDVGGEDDDLGGDVLRLRDLAESHRP